MTGHSYSRLDEQGRLAHLAGFWALLGWDIETGEQARGFRVGDGVFGVLPTDRAGGYAEYVVAPANGTIAQKPSNVGYEAAAVTTMAALTAWTSSELNPIVPDPKILLSLIGRYGESSIRIRRACVKDSWHSSIAI